jgi:L-seryl-tRNA(Ser) seleniumtransferase
MALAALSASLDHYIKGEALSTIPVWQMISATPGEIKSRAENWQKKLKMGEVLESKSMVGGGSLPGETLPTWVLAITVGHPNRLLEILRQNAPPLIGRVEDGRVLFDPRTVFSGSDSDFIKAFQLCWGKYEK